MKLFRLLRLRLQILFALLCCLPLGSTLRAQVEASLVALKSTFPSDSRTVVVGLRLVHEAHWHTYWLQPGTGFPPSLDWKLPPGWTAGPIRWPAPHRVYDRAKNLAGNGYEGVITLPVTLTPPPGLPPGEPITLRAKADWLMCKDVCMPGTAEVALTLTPTAPGDITTANVTDSAAGEDLLASLAKLPVPLPATLQATATPLGTAGKAVRFTVTGPTNGQAPLAAEPWFFASDAAIAYDQPQAAVPGQPAQVFAADLIIADYADPKPTRLVGVLTFATGPAYEIDVPFAPPLPFPATGATPGTAAASGVAGAASSSTGAGTPNAPPAPPLPAAGSLAAILVTAFFGGLILNLMPCVFPVLGLKVLGFVQQAGSDRKKITAHGLAFTGGVLLAFWTLGGLLVTFWQGSGWGTQLQNAHVNLVIAAIFLLFALSMSGVFEIGQSATRLGGVTAKGGGYWVTLLEGIFITIVATPCSAPLLGTAIGATLTTLPAPQAMLVFTSIALGLASPYLLLSSFPQGVKLLPRPGAWMETLKQLLAFPIYAAVGYFVWILVPQVSDDQHLNVILTLVLIALAGWLYGRATAPNASGRARPIPLIASFALVAAALAYGWPRAAAPTDIVWEPWSAERVAALRAEGRPIYVDFTARWCATCQVNKKAVFHGPGSGEVLKTFRDRKVATLRGDWTKSDPLITAELARWQRAAVPFNLLYLPDLPEAKPLPELLTPSIVLDALKP